MAIWINELITNAYMMASVPDTKIPYIDLDGQLFPLKIRRYRHARRLGLRLARDGMTLSISAPPHVSLRQIRDFVQRQHGWILNAQQKQPPVQTLNVGDTILYRGQPHIIDPPDPARTGVIRFEEGHVIIPARVRNLDGRIRDALVRDAGSIIRDTANLKAGSIQRTQPPITLRDTSSRWGSCTDKGRLSFSWRLIMAPPEILDYVVAHEVAHLVHMNHGRDFWDLCRDLANADVMSCRRWLRQHGRTLFAFF